MATETFSKNFSPVNRFKRRIGNFFVFSPFLLVSLFLFAPPVLAYGWRETTRMPYAGGPYRSLVFDEANRRIYLIGAREGPNYPDHPSNLTFLGVLNNDLSITWSNMSNLPLRLGSNSAVLYQGSIFSIGGEDGSSTGYSGNRIKNIYQGVLNTSGLVTGWSNRSDMTLPNSSSRGQALVYNGNIYYFDGHNNKILKSSGGSWQQVGSFPPGLFFSNVDRFTDFTVAVSNNRIYLSGGQVANSNASIRCQLNSVYTANFNADGVIGSWQKVRDHPDDVVQDRAGSGADLDFWGIKAYHLAVVHGGYLYIVGGSSANFTDNCPLPKTTYPGSNTFVNGLTGRTYQAKIASDGSLGEWRLVGCQSGADCTQFDSLLWGGNNGFGAHLGGAFIYQDKLFLLGGLNYPGFTSKVVYLDLDSPSSYACSGINAPDSVVQGSTVEVSANVANPGDVKEVGFYYVTGDLPADQYCNTSVWVNKFAIDQSADGGWSASWNTTGVAPGNYFLVANVFENSGYWCTGNPGGVCGSGANQACPCRKSVVITVSTPTPTPTLTPTPTVTPTLTPTLTLSYYTIAGYIVDSTTGTGISGDSVSIYDDALKQTVTVTTNSTGRFASPSNWARKGDYYAVRPQTPSGYVGPPGSTTVGWTWNHCTSTDTPLGSSSYECQIVSVNDCAGPSGSGVTERCNFSLTPVSPTPAPIPGDVDKNGRVDGLDVIYLISYLGNIVSCPSCDLDHNSRVDGLDVIMLIGYL